MGAVGTGAIGPVSVRYAAQIRQLLFAQAVQRMAADQEAARVQSQAERAVRVEAAPKSDAALQPPHPRTKTLEPINASEAVAEPKPVAATAPAQLVDIQA
jgi:hypothetical protein